MMGCGGGGDEVAAVCLATFQLVVLFGKKQRNGAGLCFGYVGFEGSLRSAWRRPGGRCGVTLEEVLAKAKHSTQALECHLMSLDVK